ncbi:hypothetical protein M409DRAFT_23378 [Zasmidium cellare ATCC 36951]|uniref:Uncharacterized protein n=1 Tax=Zasmidium cellare ATCC 36951 TaxID=1080233 RepID=A0A6A6CKF2_ZASCE|nr:uncharacterized protein M409DRAFT_23378 [Zasmidium cellare ATCC 36951]KAF2166189.1 hypothetical protein M409DRAFT_23378 [Zasmidium cellare ATCC 36951]
MAHAASPILLRGTRKPLRQMNNMNPTRRPRPSQAYNPERNRAAAAKHRPSKINLSYVNPRSSRLWSEYSNRRKRQFNAQRSKRNRLCPLSLQQLTAPYIRRNAVRDAFSDGHIALTAEEQQFLQHRGYTLEDVASWARIISEKDALAAANILSAQLESCGPKTVPVWVLLYTLRKEMKDMPDDFTSVVFIAVMRLLRHARDVWPQSMSTITNIVLQHLQSRQLKEGAFPKSELAKITHLLNKLINLISLSTAEHPFKDVAYQESAVMLVLQYMADCRPSLYINRQGYRGVIRIQLRQRKTTQERQWAELKSLSWPPWKVDRTAMDSELGPEHGISRAGATLARMREAGYRPFYWEKLAEVFTGWDIDQTPTIQMRSLLSSPGMMLSSKIRMTHEPWAARILSTRTIQEAWACYLAWEDEKLPPDQDVYLATFSKLHEEQRRQRMSTVIGRDESAKTMRRWPLLPGDTREIRPLPPSTHLETYTRTAPPTVTEFYRTLQNAGIDLQDRCLAFVVEHATTLDEGLERLRRARSKYPELDSVISLSRSEDVLKVPSSIYAATVKLWTRFPRSSLSKLQSHEQSADTTDTELAVLPDYRFNHDNPVVNALKLLHIRPPTDPWLWGEILQQFTASNAHTLVGLSSAIEPASASTDRLQRSQALPEHLDRYKGAMNALRLVQHIAHLQEEQNIDVTTKGFWALCRCVQNAVTASWKVLQRAARLESPLDEKFGFKLLLREAETLARESRAYREWLRCQFTSWTGEEKGLKMQTPNVEDAEEESAHHTDSPEELPKLLAVPDPASLHAYIRALGWLGDYKGLHATVRWMREYRSELLERSERDRRGEEMARRAVVALRVFLERSWIRDATLEPDPNDAAQFEYAEHSTEAASLLARARSPAEAEDIAAVREIVEDVEEWGGWPSDEEVQTYIDDKVFWETGEWTWTKWERPVPRNDDSESPPTVRHAPGLPAKHKSVRHS